MRRLSYGRAPSPVQSLAAALPKVRRTIMDHHKGGIRLHPETALAQFGLVLTAQEQLPGASQRVVKVQTDQGTWVLKRSRIREEEIEFVHAAQEHLAASGFPGAPRFRAAVDGKPYCLHQGQVLVLTSWVEGEARELKRRRDIATAVRRLAEMHARSSGFAPPAGLAVSRERTLWGRWPELWRARLDQLAVFKRLAHESDAKTAFDRRYVGLIAYYWEQAATAIAMLLRTSYRRLMEIESLQRSLCHHDLAHHNILFGPADQIHLIDLDYCITDSRLHDIGSMIIRQCKRFGWDLGWADMIIEQYSRYADLPLSAEELGVLAAFLHWPQDFWQVGLQYYLERQPWTLRRFLGSLDRKTSGRRERERFLASFRRQYAPNLGF
jgi:CotS family spore coat protein